MYHAKYSSPISLTTSPIFKPPSNAASGPSKQPLTFDEGFGLLWMESAVLGLMGGLEGEANIEP